MFWLFLLGVVALILISRALILKSSRYSNQAGIKNVNDSTKLLKSELFKLQFTENAENMEKKHLNSLKNLKKNITRIYKL